MLATWLTTLLLFSHSRDCSSTFLQVPIYSKVSDAWISVPVDWLASAKQLSTVVFMKLNNTVKQYLQKGTFCLPVFICNLYFAAENKNHFLVLKIEREEGKICKKQRGEGKKKEKRKKESPNSQLVEIGRVPHVPRSHFGRWISSFYPVYINEESVQNL